jgi:nucleoid DNA-binding protein
MAKGGKKALTKSALLAELAEKTELSKKQVDAVLNEIVELVKRELSGKGAGKVVIPGLARMTVTKVKAVKGGVEKKNPLTGAMYVTKDKPAYNKVRLSPIKALKEALK